MDGLHVAGNDSVKLIRRQCKFRALGGNRNRCIRCGLEITSRHPPERIHADCGNQRDGLGDYVERVLRAVGITPARVQAVTRKPCGCLERQEKLNAVGRKIGL